MEDWRGGDGRGEVWVHRHEVDWLSALVTYLCLYLCNTCASS